jgi:hypothetical protein
VETEKKNSTRLFDIFHAHLLLGQLELALGDETVLVPVHGVEGQLAVHIQVQEIPAVEFKSAHKYCLPQYIYFSKNVVSIISFDSIMFIDKLLYSVRGIW